MRGGRRRPGHLRLARGRGEEHPPLREALPRRPRGPPGAELPLHRPHPGLRQRGHRPEPRPQAQEALHRGRRGRDGRRWSRSRARRRRPASWPRRSRGSAGRGAPGRTSRCSTGSTRSRVPSRRRFREASMPHTVHGGPAFFDRAEVRDLLAYLKLCIQPEDDVSLSRIVNVPARGIGDTSMERVHDWAIAHKEPLLEALRQAERRSRTCRAARPSGSTAFVELVDRYRARFREGNAAEVARGLVAEIDLYSHARASVQSLEAGARKVEGIDGLLRSLESYTQRIGPPPPGRLAAAPGARLARRGGPGGRGRHLAHDAARRQGARVPGGVPGGGGGGLPALRRHAGRAARPGRGAPPRLRGDHACPGAALPDPCGSAHQAGQGPAPHPLAVPGRAAGGGAGGWSIPRPGSAPQDVAAHTESVMAGLRAQAGGSSR